ncbi:MAG TPA: hemerythrin domain-containing protein [Polyangia bacterium]|nr:hemerythrin domain-containing protein [Polyangia bacterium]
MAPDHQLDAETARRAIHAQHEKIRRLLGRAQSTADATLEGSPLSPDAVASVIGDLRSTMEVHLTFEERVLLPILERDPPLGPERASRLRDEHRQQRGILAAIHREAAAQPLLPTLAAKLAYLAAWLLDDMAEEERELLTPDVLRDDAVSIDQNTG